MPIGDLLAQISGDKSTSTPKQSPILKRKADDALRDPAAKTPRTASAANVSARSNLDAKSAARPDNRSTPVTSTSSSSGTKSTPGSRPLHSKTPNDSVKRTVPTPSKTGVVSRSVSAPAKPITKPATGDAANKAPPKKGSFAEIMARAQMAQASMANVGKIQHKPIERGPTKRERQEMKAEQARTARKGGAVAPRSPANKTGYAGSARPKPNGSSALTRDRNGNGVVDPRGSTNGKTGKAKGAPVEEKKPKKAAVATTGYTGTARGARPSPAQKSSAADASVDRRPRERPRVPFGAPRRSRHDDEYDEELDDFIEYDDEEEEEPGYGYGGGGGGRGRGGPRYDYASEEDESDMEAGISDIDEEEARSRVLAQREDQREMALEAKLKREKEERKRRFYDSAKDKRDRR